MVFKKKKDLSPEELAKKAEVDAVNAGYTLRVYKYGIPHGPLPEHRDAVKEQFWLANRYWNDLCAVERDKRRQIDEILSDKPAMVEIEGAIESLTRQILELREGVNEAKKEARKNVRVPPEIRAKIKDLEAQRKKMNAVAREIRAIERKDPRCLAVYAEADAKQRELRKASGVFWGTYLLVEKAMQAARVAKRKPARNELVKEGEEPEEKRIAGPRFKRFDGTGSVGVQIQTESEYPLRSGISVAQALSGNDTRLRVHPVDDSVWTLRRGDRRRATRTKVDLRIGSTGPGNREPVWATFPFIMHRPLPDDAVIKWAYVQARRIGPRFRWELCLVVQCKPRNEAPSEAGDVVAIDFGARGRAGGYAVAAAVGTDGKIHTLALPRVKRKILDGYGPDGTPRYRETFLMVEEVLEHVDSLKSIRDRLFDQARGFALAWKKGTPVDLDLPMSLEKRSQVPDGTVGRIAATGSVIPRPEELPEFLTDAMKHMGLWKSQRRMVKLVYHWKNNRFEGDEVLFDILMGWSRQDHHLYEWESCERSRVLGCRKETYRIWAARLAKQYRALVVEDVNFAKMQKRSDPEDKPDHYSNKTKNQASPGALRAICFQAFEATHGQGRDAVALGSEWRKSSALLVLPTTGRSHTCPSCGHSDAVETDRTLSCSECGATVDTDFARAWNLLKDAGCDTSAVRATWNMGRSFANKAHTARPATMHDSL